MTEQELQKLQIDRSNAKIRMKETWESLHQLRKMSKLFETDYLRWSNRYERADMALAEEDGRLKKLAEKRGQPKVEVELTMAQLIKIAEKLGITLETKGEENEKNKDS
jgi:hypothetical protein